MQVRDTFQDQDAEYDSFRDIMREYYFQRLDPAGTIVRVKELFKNHRHLISGFNTFLPKGYEITLDDEEQAPSKSTVEFEEALCFFNKIMKQFKKHNHVYKLFINLLNMYWVEDTDTTQAYGEVALLFSDHPDLIGEFMRFLPDSSPPISAVSQDSLSHKNGYEINLCKRVKEKLNNADDYEEFMSYLNLYSTKMIDMHELQSLVGSLFKNRRDLLEDFNEFLEHYNHIKSSSNKRTSLKAMRIDNEENERHQERVVEEEKEGYITMIIDDEENEQHQERGG